MSFQNQGFWVAKGTGTVNDGEVNDDGGSRNDHKRSHLWYMDGSEADIFPNKKHVAGIPSNNIFTGMINSNISPWGNASSFHSMSGHFADRLFDSETARTANFDVRNMPSVGEEKVDMERKLEDSQFSNNSSFGLSMSSALEDPRSGVNYGGIRKVKVSQVKESESATMPVSLEHAYSVMENSAVPVPNPYNKSDENNISMGLAYNKVDGGIMSIGNSYERDNNNIFMSMGQPYSKGDDGASMNQTYNGSDDTLSISHTFSKGDENFISMGQNYDKADENAISMAHVYSKGHDVPISMTQDGSNSVSIVQSYSKGESTMISFGSGYDDDDRNPSGRLISSYELMMAQPSLETSAALSDKQLPKSNPEANAVVADAVASGTDNASKRKEDSRISKKVPTNSFPSNVRSLLSTGMLDGVPVKYIAWSREKELRGVIKGSGYLCGCQTCNFSKVINAYEFERHANCKTKHPNNHIYFENGKTIYGIVQELRSTPQNILFDVIQTITGSPINLKSFRIWKESFLAATRELQRIYGKDEGKPL